MGRLKSILKSSFFFFLLLYLCGRLTLIIHEFIGHALPVYIFGHKLTETTFQYFGDAWVQYLYTGPYSEKQETAILSGGVTFAELVIGFILLTTKKLLSSKPYTKLFCLLLASVLILHAFVYTIIGFYFQLGDGKFLSYIIGEEQAKQYSLILLAPTFLFSYTLANEYAKNLTQLFQTKALLKLGVCGTLALSFHLGLNTT